MTSPKVLTIHDTIIDRDVPIPSRAPTEETPFARLAVGESILVPASLATASRGQCAALKRRRAATGWSYVSRSYPDKSVRFWRTA